MRNYLIIFSLFFSVLSFGQGQGNPFVGENTNSNSGNLYSKPQSVDGEEQLRTPDPNSNDKAFDATETERAAADGGPGSDGLPIDDYIPVFIVVAVGIIFYKRRSLAKA